MNAYIIFNKNTNELLAVTTQIPEARGLAQRELLYFVNATDEDRQSISEYTRGILDTSVGLQLIEVSRECAIKLAEKQWFS